MSIWFGVSTDAYRRTDGRRLAFAHGKIDFTLRWIARAAGKRQRAENDADGSEILERAISGQRHASARPLLGRNPENVALRQRSPCQ